MERRRDVFQAIADPRRREILALIAGKEMNVNALADHFSVSRPAISRRVKILHECGLLDIKQMGRERYCRVQAQPLEEVADWVAQYRQFWETKLDSFETYINELNQIHTKHEQQE